MSHVVNLVICLPVHLHISRPTPFTSIEGFRYPPCYPLDTRKYENNPWIQVHLRWIVGGLFIIRWCICQHQSSLVDKTYRLSTAYSQQMHNHDRDNRIRNSAKCPVIHTIHMAYYSDYLPCISIKTDNIATRDQRRTTYRCLTHRLE